jgi:hypothetical protein
MGVSTTIKKIKFMYKGDGIEADVAKCAMTNGDSERKGDLEKLINQLTQLVDEKKEKKPESSMVPALPDCGCKTACEKCEKGCCSNKPATCPVTTCCPAPCPSTSCSTPCCPAASSPCCPTACEKCDKDVSKCKCEENAEKKGKCEEKKKAEEDYMPFDD